MYNINKILIILLFFCSFYGIIYSRTNLIINLIFIELGFLSINILLFLISWGYNDIGAQIIIIYILTLTAIETAIGLALFILYYKLFKNIEVKNFYKLKI